MRPLPRSLIAGLMLLFAGLVVLTTWTPARAEGEAITGTMIVTQTKDPVRGVRVTVTDAAGERVGTARSNADGRFRVALPGPGTYTVTLDARTLPKDVELVNATTRTRTVTVDPGATGAAFFRLSDGGTLGPRAESKWLQLLAEGVRFGLIIAITAIGLSLVFGTTGLTNFAHGELVSVGAFAAFWANTSLGAPLWLAAGVAIVVGIAAGAVNDLAVWRPLRNRRTGLVAMLVISIGLSIALRSALLLLVGERTEFYDVPAQREVDLGPIALTPADMTAMCVCVVVLVGVALLLQYTRIGQAMRAVADNRDLAAASGINVDRVILTVWMLGGGLAALGGVIYGWTLNLRYDMGFTLLLMMFAGVTLGGLGTAYGALVGSLVIGVLVQLSTEFLPSDIKYVAGLAMLIVILLIRPSGILGARQRLG